MKTAVSNEEGNKVLTIRAICNEPLKGLAQIVSQDHLHGLNDPPARNQSITNLSSSMCFCMRI